MLLAIVGCVGGAPEQRSSAPAKTRVEATDVSPELQRDYSNAQTLMSVEDYEGAAEILQPLAVSYPEYPAVSTLLAIAWRKLALTEQAQGLLESTLAAHEDFAPALNEVGILYRESGDFAAAEAAYMKAVTVKPDYALAHFNFGILLDLYLGRHEQALTHYERYQELAPGEDKQVGRWIADISRRLERSARTAKVGQ